MAGSEPISINSINQRVRRRAPLWLLAGPSSGSLSETERIAVVGCSAHGTAVALGLQTVATILKKPEAGAGPRPGSEAGSRARPGPRSCPEAGTGSGVYYQNCDAVRAAGAAPIYPGDPGWQDKFDRDNDGVGCES